MTHANNASEFAEPIDEIVQYLFEDIARLPIITNRAQELLLGIQLRAPHRLQQLEPSVRASSDTPFDLTRYRQTSFVEGDGQSIHWDSIPNIGKELESGLLALTELSFQIIGSSQVKLAAWAGELLAARSNVYELKRSRLRRFIDKLHKESSVPDDEVERFKKLTYRSIELMALLPDRTIRRLINLHQEHNRPPGAEELNAWLAGDTSASQLVQAVIMRQDRATQQLSTGYARYVLRVARNYVDSPLDFSDLVQAGFLGLLRATKKFDYRRNARFGTYATSWIWQSITRSIIDEGYCIRLPTHAHEQLQILEKAIILHDDGYTEPLENPIVLREANLLKPSANAKSSNSNDNVSVERDQREVTASRVAKRLLMRRQTLVPMDTLVDSSTNDSEPILELRDCLTCTTDVEARVMDKLTRDLAEKVLAPLTERQREVMEYRYGFKGGREHTLAEVGSIYGLTRERIRQIEARAKKQLNNPRLWHRSSDIQPEFLGPYPDRWANLKPPIPSFNLLDSVSIVPSQNGHNTNWSWLDQLIDDLPRSNWRERFTGPAGSVRSDEITAALQSLGAPAHHSEIIELANELHASTEPLSAEHGYRRLATDENQFVPLGEGVFSLVLWEEARTAKPEPILPFCPQSLPDPPDFENAFFESIIVGREELRTPLTADQFLAKMFRWADAPAEQKSWIRQGVMNAYYLVGLTPYSYIFSGASPSIHSTLPAGTIADIRRHCLQSLTERLVAMPGFWWLLHTMQPALASDLGEQFTDLHPDNLDDAAPRLALLVGLGAAARSDSGHYRLTSLGEACALEWGKAREADEAVFVLADGDESDDLLGFSFWD